MWTCKHCSNEFSFTRTTEKANHSRWCEHNPRSATLRAENKRRMSKRLDERHGKLIRYPVVCDACGVEFTVKERQLIFPSKPKYFCSRSCANSCGGKQKAKLYHSDDVAHYTTVCFRHHDKACVVCNERNIVAVHHYDENRNNNDPANLIPLCPTHHTYMHSKFKVLIERDVMEYIKNWKLTHN